MINKIKVAIFWDKAKIQANRIALAVVITEIVLVILMAIALNNGVLSYLQPKVIYIESSQAKEPESKEESKEETVKEVIERVAEDKEFENVALLVRIAKCESSLDRYAMNPKSSAKGIYQILDMHKLTVAERFDPEVATKWAIDKINADGTGAWNESKNCWSK